MGNRVTMRADDGACPRCGGRDARAVRLGDDWHVVCDECGYAAQGFSNPEGAWEIWNEADAGATLPGLAGRAGGGGGTWRSRG